MSKKKRPPIPVNVIAGPLGVGKTTTINHLLAQKPENEKWAILVNEYGLIGLDAALMEPVEGNKARTGVDIREVSGGCICCSAGFMFEVSLVMLLQRRPDRLLIEPTGLAALSGILDTLDREGIRESVDIRSIVCLLDPKRVQTDLLKDEVSDQVEAADVLLASRSDLATPAEIEAFTAWADGLFPPKRFVGLMEHGQLGIESLDLVSGRETKVARAGHQHGTDHSHHEHGHHDTHQGHDHHDHHHVHHDHQHDDTPRIDDTDTAEAQIDLTCDAANPVVKRVHLSDVASTVGWVCWSELVFNADRVFPWIRGLVQHPSARRAKAVLRTDQGWWGFNCADGVDTVQPSGYRRDSRLEIIFDGEDIPDLEDLERSLRDCVVDTPA